ncbi:hypothetical protein [Azospirillum argentinense]|uniref:Uncharacterized protein n=1 Tax=Azospirillum brasilense TaxID=192 RepID=A0A4D8Q443_AZOBR|nr:hypothetical protein [Azospirillum argentinense]QCO03316.1 hypothetical protein D3867_14510 [Azospirillum argentinense]
MEIHPEWSADTREPGVLVGSKRYLFTLDHHGGHLEHELVRAPTSQGKTEIEGAKMRTKLRLFLRIVVTLLSFVAIGLVVAL